MKPNPTIATKRLHLRWYEDEDLDDLAELFGNPEVMRFSLRGVHTHEQCSELLQQWKDEYVEHGFGKFAVSLKDNPKVIGYCGFYFQCIDGVDEIELGYRFLPEFWGKGIASEAASAVQDYAFNTLGLTRLISIIEAENIGSIRVAEKNGFHHEKDSIYAGKIPVRIYSKSPTS